MSGSFSFSTPQVDIGPVSGQITACTLKFNFPKGGAKTFEGEVDIKMGGTDGSGGQVKLKYVGGKFDWEGDLNIKAETVTDGWVTGDLKLSKGASGSSYAGVGLNFAKGPLVGVIKDISASYSKTEGFSGRRHAHPRTSSTGFCPAAPARRAR